MNSYFESGDWEEVLDGLERRGVSSFTFGYTPGPDGYERPLDEYLSGKVSGVPNRERAAIDVEITPLEIHLLKSGLTLEDIKVAKDFVDLFWLRQFLDDLFVKQGIDFDSLKARFVSEGQNVFEGLEWLHAGLQTTRREWQARNFNAREAERICRGVSLEMTMEEIFDGIDVLKSLGQVVTPEALIEFRGRSAQEVRKELSSRAKKTELMITTDDGNLYGIVPSRDVQPEEAPDKDSSESKDSVFGRLSALGLSRTDLDEVELYDLCLEELLDDLGYVVNLTGRTIEDLRQQCEFSSFLDFADWIHLGRIIFDRDSSYFVDPFGSRSIGPFLEAGLSVRECLDWFWIGNNSYYFELDEWQPPESESFNLDLDHPLLFFRAGFTPRQAAFVLGSEFEFDYWDIAGFVEEGVPAAEIIEWMDEDFWAHPLRELGSEADYDCFLGWRRRGFTPEQARRIRGEHFGRHEARYVGPDAFLTMDSLKTLGMEVTDEAILKYLGLSAGQILWLVDHGFNDELPRTLVRLGAPLDNLADLVSKFGDGVSTSVIELLAKESEDFWSLVLNDSQTLLLDLLRRLPGERDSTVRNAAALSKEMRGLTSEEIVRWARISGDKTHVQAWIDHSFSPQDALDWVKSGVNDPVVADRRRQAGIPPSSPTR